LAIQAIRSMQDRLKATVNASVLGTVDPLTPLSALASSVAFGICFYIIWSAAFKVIVNKKAESSIWMHQEGDSYETKDKSH